MKALPEPYYDRGGITIYHGDCRLIMPLLPQVDLILTDPPYGLNYHNGDLAHYRESVFGGNKGREVARPIANDGEQEALELFESILRLAKKGCSKEGAAAAAGVEARSHCSQSG